jgi:integration host factor subunit beta
MTKSELIETIAEKLKLPKGKAELIINCIFDSMEASLTQGERIEIRGFGSFEIRDYKPYEGRNPRTGTKVGVQPKRLPFFKVGKELKERVNSGLTQSSSRATGNNMGQERLNGEDPISTTDSSTNMPHPTIPESRQIRSC